MAEYDILADTFCLYCQEDFGTPRKLKNHVAKEHPGTYADGSITEAARKRKLTTGITLPRELP